MKPGTLLLTAAVVLPGAWALGADATNGPKPVVSYDIKHDVSPPLRLIPVAPPRPGPNRQIPLGRVERKNGIYPAPLLEDPLLRGQGAPAAPMPPPLVSFDGTSDDDNAAVIGFRVVPPDTNGDVGPNHYVQFNNLIFEIFNKSGTSVFGPVAGNTPWAGFGGPCQTNNDGDPIALYDQLADRWILSQFSIDEGTQCVAVSTTPDPTGSYFRYAFLVTPGGQNDYPKFGLWPDAYYSSYRRFPGSSFRIVAAAFDRAQMLAGAPAQMVTFNIVPPSGLGCLGSGDCYDGILPAHLEGMTPPPAGAPGLFVTAFDDEFNQGSGGGTPNPAQDFYKIWRFHVDFAVPANSTLTGPINVASAEFDENLCGGNPCVPQPAPGEILDHLSFFTMYRPSYRNLGGIESLLVNNTVNVGGSRAGIRWAEIRNLATTPSLFQSGTHAPADAVHRWMGSMAMDVNGNIALGFSASSTSLFPSIRYVGRLAGDPAGTLPQTEVDLIAGAGVQTGSFNRWGDYSAMSVDESDECTFWYTTEYYANTGSFDFKTRIGSFRFPTCIVPVQLLGFTVE